MKSQRLIVKLAGFLICALISFNALSQMIEGTQNSVQPLKKTAELTPLHPEKLRLALKKAFGVTHLEKIEPLNGGFSNAKLYKILVNNKYYVLRLSNNNLEDLKAEINCMILASGIGVAPKVHYANAKEGIILMDYVQNKALSDKELSDPKIFIQLATILNRLHTEKPSFPKFRHKTIITLLLEKEESLHWGNKPPLVSEGIRKLKTINQKLLKLKVNKSSHNDLNPNNILYDGEKFTLIDWESAGLSDPFFDLATVSNFMIFDEKIIGAEFLRNDMSK